MSKKYKAEHVLPYDAKSSKTSQIKRMFDSIAHSYDLLNRVLSFGIDKIWRRKALKRVAQFSPKKLLDVATGTGDFAILAAKKINPDQIIGIDLSQGMLDVGREKVKKGHLDQLITFEQQDCLNLSFEDHTFDAITVAFGVRNFEELEKGYAEMYRVLKPGGVLLVLELSTPERAPMKQLYKFYSATVIPFLGKIFSKDRSAYDYLNKSVQVVPQGEEMAQIFCNVGFKDVRYERYTFGICTCYYATK